MISPCPGRWIARFIARCPGAIMVGSTDRPRSRFRRWRGAATLVRGVAVRALLFFLVLFWLTPIGVVLMSAERRGRGYGDCWWPVLLSWPGALIALGLHGGSGGGRPKLTDEWRRYYAHVRQCPGFRCRKREPATDCVEGSALYGEYRVARVRIEDASNSSRSELRSRWWQRPSWLVLGTALIVIVIILIDPGTWHSCDIVSSDSLGMPVVGTVVVPFGCP